MRERRGHTAFTGQGPARVREKQTHALKYLQKASAEDAGLVQSPEEVPLQKSQVSHGPGHSHSCGKQENHLGSPLKICQRK